MMNYSEIKAHIENTNNALFKKIGKTFSVSKCLGVLSEEFDAETQSVKCSLRDKDNPDGQYYNMSPEEIRDMWTNKADESKRYGIMSDDYIGFNLNKEYDELELWKLDNNLENDARLQGYCKGFDEFITVLAKTSDYVYVARELPMIITTPKGHSINGRFDCLFYSPSRNRFLLIDWKTTENIKMAGFNHKKMKGMACDYDDCDINKYTLQLHFYKKALVETYNITNSYDNIDVFVCNFSKIQNEFGKNFKLIKQNFDFSIDKLNQIIDYAVEKNEILKKINKKNNKK